MKIGGHLVFSERRNRAIALVGFSVFLMTVVPGFTQGATDVLPSTGQPNNQVVATISVGAAPQAVVVNGNSGLVYVANAGSNTVSVIYAATNTIATTIPVSNGAGHLAITPDSRTLYVANVPNSLGGAVTVSVIYTPTNTLTTTFYAGGYAGNGIDLAVSPDGAKLYFINGFGPGSGVDVYDTATNQHSGTIFLTGPGVGGTLPLTVAFNPSGGLAYVTSTAPVHQSNRLFVSKIDTASEKQIDSTDLGSGGGYSGWVSTDGHKVYVTNPAGNYKNHIVVLSAKSNKVVKTIRVGFGSDLVQNAVTPDGKYLYVTSSDPNTNSNKVAAINTATGRLLGSPLQLGQGYMPAIAIAPDGLRAYVTNDLDNTVSVIDISPQ